MQLYESRLSYFNDKASINNCKSPSVHQHCGPSRPRQNCHSCIFETKENSNLRICIQYLGHHSKTTCRKSAKSMRYSVRPKFENYRKSLLREHSFFRRGGGPEEFRGGLLTFCLPQKREGQHKFDTTKRGGHLILFLILYKFVQTDL